MTLFHVVSVLTYGQYENHQGELIEVGEKEKFFCFDAYMNPVSSETIRSAIDANGKSFNMFVEAPWETVTFPSGEDPNNLNYCYTVRD